MPQGATEGYWPAECGHKCMSTGMGEVSSLLRKPEKHQQRGYKGEKHTQALNFGPLTNKTFDGFQRENFTLFFIKGEIYFFNHFLFSLCSFSLPRFLVHLSVCFFKPSVLKSTDLWGTDVFFYFIWCREFLNSLLILSPWLPGNSGLRFILCFIQLHFFLADFFFFFFW